jgi:hypothetical protein
VTGRVPLGYKVVYDERGYNLQKVVDPEVMRLVEEAKALRTKGASLRAIRLVMASKRLPVSHVSINAMTTK